MRPRSLPAGTSSCQGHLLRLVSSSFSTSFSVSSCFVDASARAVSLGGHQPPQIAQPNKTIEVFLLAPSHHVPQRNFSDRAAISSRLTASHPNSEVKLDRAGVVLRWGTTREGPVLLFSFYYIFAFFLTHTIHTHPYPYCVREGRGQQSSPRAPQTHAWGYPPVRFGLY